MEFTQVVNERYACKKFDGRAVPRDILTEILLAGRAAPTAKNLQGQRIYVLESAEALAKFDQASPCRYGAETVLVVAFNTEEVFHYPGGQRDSGIEDASIVATHLMLAAKNAGVESCWINRFDPAEMKRVLGLPENEEVLMALDLGYPAKDAGPLPNHGSRKPLEETVRFI
jgi:nitroreductase